MLNLVIYGPPGSGKGTHSKLLAKRYNLFHISFGDFLRTEKEKKSSLGILIEPYLNAGKLVPDRIVFNCLRKILDIKTSKQGFIFDGFPRTLEQAKGLTKIMEEKGDSLKLTIDLSVNKTCYLQRIEARSPDNQREDDKIKETVEQRINSYIANSKGIIRYYKRLNKYKRIFAHQTKEITHQQICQRVDSFFK